MSNRSPHTLGLLAQTSAALGRMDGVRAILAELLARAREGYVPPATIAEIFTLVGDIDNGLAWMARAFEEKANYVVYMEVASSAAPLQRDPRFRELVARSGLQ
jgi:hypothetical protein